MEGEIEYAECPEVQDMGQKKYILQIKWSGKIITLKMEFWERVKIGIY